MREIVLDTETTGFDPANGDRIVEIGCVELVNQVPTGLHWHSYINPERDMPDSAFAVHGLSADFLSDKPLFPDIVGDWLDFVRDARLVIHNAPFDMKFLNAELKRAGYPSWPPNMVLDTLAMARAKFPGAPAGLDALCKRFEIDNSARVYHGALLDAELLAEVYIELLGGRQRGLVLEAGGRDARPLENGSSAGQDPGRSGAQNGVQHPYREPRSFPPSEAETEAHARMLEELKDPLWAGREPGAA